MSTLVATLSRWKRALSALLLIPPSEPLDYPFVTSDIAQLQRLRHDGATAAIDAATAHDLLLDDWHARLSAGVSIFGQQALYRRQREGPCGMQPERVKALLADPAQRAQLQETCKPLRHAGTEIASLLYDHQLPALPRWAGKTWPLPIVLLASIAAAFLWPAAWLATGAVLFFLMSNQMRYALRVEEWQRTLTALQALLGVATRLGGKDAGAAARLNRALTRMALPGVRGYQDWFALENVNHYARTVRLVAAHLPLLGDCFDQVAELEADLALARHLADTPQFCWSARSATSALALEAMVHPLLPHAQPLDLKQHGKGVFISGQNGVGKSTLLRTLGINLVASRAFGFCYARQAQLPDLPVYSSMQSEDSLFGGESLYMAELRRAKELLAAADGAHPGIYLIDEIFRGTNHLESVSAAAAVLDALAARGTVIVSSHNLVLASLLAHRLDPLCVARDGGALCVRPGVLAHTNGIALLAERGFGSGIEHNAGKVFEWLNGYLAHPADCSGVLAAEGTRSTLPSVPPQRAAAFADTAASQT